MAKVDLDARGLKCPLPALKMNNMLLKSEVKAGDVLEVLADCATFEKDLKDWCSRTKKVLVFIRQEGNGVKRCQVQI
jgi:tRNA 2-thiouridine synthesizing protein A